MDETRKKIQVAILEDHQSIIDGYVFRLSQKPEIVIVDYINYGEGLVQMLDKHQIDLLILDVHVPTSSENRNPYPIIYTIPQLLQQYPKLNILVISMHDQATLINAVMDAGASGFILKDDIFTIQKLGEVVKIITEGGIFLSQRAYQQLYKKIPKEETPTPRQLEMLSLCAAYPNATTAELAHKLQIANSTALNLLSGIYVRLKVQTRTAAILEAQRLGLLPFIDRTTEI